MTSAARVAIGIGAALVVVIASGLGCGSRWSGGIHARMAWSEVGGLRVVDVPEDGPAWEAGLRPGDRITSIDGTEIAGKSQQEVVGMLRGDVGTNVELEVQREGEELLVVIERAPYMEE